MDFVDRFRKLSDRLSQLKPHIQTEQATQQALVLPFIKELGYDVYNPAEVVPEFTADVGTKKNEKVDYAILRDGDPILLIECKDFDIKLGREHRSQLSRYFMVTKARYGILTNGIIYQFFTELDEKNQMDNTPFLILDMENLDERLVRQLEHFTRDAFDAEKIFSSARELRFMRDIGREIAAEFREPSRDLVRHFAKQVYSGPLTKGRMEEFTHFVREALRTHVNDQVRSRLQSAMQTEGEETSISDSDKVASDAERSDAARQAWKTRRHSQDVQKNGGPGFEYYQYWKQLLANPEMHRVFESLCEHASSLGDDVRVYPTKYHINLSRKQRFGYLIFRPQRKLWLLNVRPDPDPKTYTWKAASRVCRRIQRVIHLAPYKSPSAAMTTLSAPSR